MTARPEERPVDPAETLREKLRRLLEEAPAGTALPTPPAGAPPPPRPWSDTDHDDGQES